MRPIEERHISPEILLCHSLVRHKHKILYDLCGSISLMWFDLYGLSLFIQNNLSLRKVKVNRSPSPSAFSEDIRKFFHLQDHWNDFFVFTQSLFLTLQDLGNSIVAHSFVHADHCLCDLVVQHLTGRTDCHDTRQCQALLPRIQRADPI